ncbi:MAG: MOSC domain-containing protein [Sterolibacteriaceae bacterium MAG5]|nr:MOSC domain-containing protein [Candidatus Nitricoxidireducens bremensis]
MAVVTLFTGGIRPLPPENQPTGMFKDERFEPVWAGLEGFAGDAQADRRVHGGPEKALHQYSAENYARLAAAFPEAASLLVPGSLGENISVPGWTEADVCIGDVFRLGDARIQVSQPRSPCWKIDRRYGVEGMTQFIDREGVTGWYFRVVEEGEAAPGCAFELLERTAPDASIARLWRLWREHRPDPADLDALAATPGLSPNWVKKLADRAAWLRTNAS